MSTALESAGAKLFERKADGEAWLIETRHDATGRVKARAEMIKKIPQREDPRPFIPNQS